MLCLFKIYLPVLPLVDAIWLFKIYLPVLPLVDVCGCINIARKVVYSCSISRVTPCSGVFTFENVEA